MANTDCIWSADSPSRDPHHRGGHQHGATNRGDRSAGAGYRLVPECGDLSSPSEGITVPASLPLRGLRGAASQRHFQAADQLRHIIRVNHHGGLCIQPLQNAVQPPRALGLRTPPQPLTQGIIPLRSRSQPAKTNGRNSKRKTFELKIMNSPRRRPVGGARTDLR